MSTGTVITFYSYKGGVGRTLALANVAALLSQWGYKVLCVDWDLEAPGLHLYFREWTKWGDSAASIEWTEQNNKQGLIELIHAYVNDQKPRWQNYVSSIKLPRAKEPLNLMSAGTQDKFYVKRLQSLNWESLYETKKFGNFLEELRNEWKQEFDFVLLDSRTGITDIGGICTVQFPDLVCLLFTRKSSEFIWGS